MNSVVILWLLLAGPLWGAIGAYLLPGTDKTKIGNNRASLRLTGLLSGFALGPIGVGYFYRQGVTPGRLLRWVLGLIAILFASQVVVRIDDPNIPFTVWFLLAGPVWALAGAYFVPRRYRTLGLDDTSTFMIGSLAGFATGVFGLALLWLDTPKLNRDWTGSLSVLGGWTLYTIFALYNPTNLCVAAPYHVTYLTQQTLNGLTIGAIYALMAVGLTLIYSVQGIVSFAHGQFYMIGGYFSFYFISFVADNFGVELNPIWGIPVAGVIAFLIGAAFERFFLRPMHTGRIERVSEYAILITFGFGFFIEYTTLWLAGPFPQRADRFIEVRQFAFALEADREAVFGPIRIIGDRAFATLIGVGLIFALLYFLNRTWTGRALRAVSQDKQAAAVTGINPLNMNTLAFGIGTMLAAMSGAALIPIFAFVPWAGAEMAGRSYIIVVLGGLGSVPGALVGGLIVGVVEALGAGCFPDPSKGAAYKEAFALVIFALVLLLKPTGLFGREQL
ncbi:MAG: branched-chain amino acid ABC transporter permease [Aggregatilineales bacterium]